MMIFSLACIVIYSVGRRTYTIDAIPALSVSCGLTVREIAYQSTMTASRRSVRLASFAVLDNHPACQLHHRNTDALAHFPFLTIISRLSASYQLSTWDTGGSGSRLRGIIPRLQLGLRKRTRRTRVAEGSSDERRYHQSE